MNIPTQNNKYEYDINDEIDLKSITSILLRNKLKIIFSTLMGIILSFSYNKVTKEKWEGQFKIVLEGNNTSGILGELSVLNNLSTSIGKNSIIKNNKNNLETEVEILKSSSVLKPVYKFVKDIKNENGINTSQWNYNKWVKGNLKFDLAKGTSVLLVKYNDTDKSLLIPVLEKVSNEYQKYSGRDRQRSIDQALTYVEEQVKEIRKESEKSIREFHNYALENELGSFDGLPPQLSTLDKININKGNNIDNKIISLKNFSTLTPSINSRTRYRESFLLLAKLENELISKSALLKEDSRIIKSLKKQIDILKNSISRPREVLLKFRELERKAISKQQILFTLENKLNELNFDKAKQTNPWELISLPTINEDPIAPKKVRNIGLAAITGFLSGLIFSYLYERNTDLIYDLDDLIEIIKIPLILTLPIKVIHKWDNSLKLFIESYPENKGKKNIAFISLDPNFKNEYKLFKDKLKKLIDVNEFVITDSIEEIQKYNQKVLIFYPGSITKTKLRLLKEELILKKNQIIGIIYFDPFIKENQLI